MRRAADGRIASLLALSLLAWASPSVRAVEPTPGYLPVQQAFLREDFQEVTELAQRFILQNPHAAEVPQVWLWLALSLDRLHRSDEAVRELNRLKGRLKASDALWPEVLFWEGDINRRAFQMAMAKAAYQQLIERYPDSVWSVQAELGVGLVCLHQEALPQAIAHFQAVARKRAETPIALDAKLYEGIARLRLKQFAEAAAVFGPLVERPQEQGGLAQAAFYFGESLSGLARYDEAAAAYQRAIADSPASPWGRLALFGLGWAYYKSGRWQESATAFERYVTQQGIEHRTEALFALGSSLLQLGREADALSRFEQIISTDPDHPLALESALVIVGVYRRQERLILAKELLHAMLRRPLDDTSRARIQLQLGAIALEQNNAVQAKTIFSLAAQSLEPSVRQAALNGLGDVQMFVGNPAGAKECYTQAMQTARDTPQAAYAAYQAGRVALQLGSPSEAVEIFQRLVDNKDSVLADDARLALALAYLNQHEESLARSLLEAIRQTRAGSVIAARAAYYLAALVLDAGDAAGARQLCQETLAHAAGSDEAIEAQLLLVDIQASETSTTDALQSLRRAYASTATLPNRHRARLAKHVGDLARSAGAYAEAIRWYDEAAGLLPSLAGEVDYRIASCYEEAGDIEQAIHWYGHLDQPPWRVRGQLAEAKLLEREDRLSDAEAIYRLIAGEDVPEAKLARERLSAVKKSPITKESRW